MYFCLLGAMDTLPAGLAASSSDFACTEVRENVLLLSYLFSFSS